MNNPKYKNGFNFTLHPETIDLPLHWKKPRSVFVDSMSDLFHESMPEEFLNGVFGVMEKANWHQYQVLTKRPERMKDFVNRRYQGIGEGQCPSHIWLGTSVELALYKKRIETLRQTNCKIRFLSCEPLLGPLGDLDLDGISQVVVGGESGPHHRPMEADWVREIRDQCVRHGVAFSFKQWSGQSPKQAGRLLDGRIWDEYPLG